MVRKPCRRLRKQHTPRNGGIGSLMRTFLRINARRVSALGLVTAAVVGAAGVMNPASASSTAGSAHTPLANHAGHTAHESSKAQQLPAPPKPLQRRPAERVVV